MFGPYEERQIRLNVAAVRGRSRVGDDGQCVCPSKTVFEKMDGKTLCYGAVLVALALRVA